MWTDWPHLWLPLFVFPSLPVHPESLCGLPCKPQVHMPGTALDWVVRAHQ